jgi:SAM-dependent methyltransferase
LRAEELRLQATHVLDVGCGSGEGLRYLSRYYRRTTGIDKDSRALAFARQIAKDARLIQADLLTSAFRLEPMQLAYIIDVLGHVERPESVLRTLAERLAPPQTLIVAEQSATADQRLFAPARRAYSERGLHSLLLRSGFIVEQWLSVTGPFLAVQAIAHRDPCVAALTDAEKQFEHGAFESALELTTRACRTSMPGLKFEAKLSKARLLIELQRRDAATAILLEARELDPTDARPLAALSQLAKLAGNDAEALMMAKEATSLDLLEISGVCALGSLCREMQPRAALDAWLVAHALAPDHSGVALQLCETALSLDDCALAITVLERLRRYHPNTQQAGHYIAMAWLLAQSGRPIQAQLEAKLAEVLEPSSPELLELREFIRHLSTT